MNSGVSVSVGRFQYSHIHVVTHEGAFPLLFRNLMSNVIEFGMEFQTETLILVKHFLCF